MIRAALALALLLGSASAQTATVVRGTGVVYRATFVRDVGSLAANTCEAWQVAVPGVALTGECIVGIPGSGDARIQVLCHVHAAGAIEIHACNLGAIPIDPVSATYSARIFNP